MIQSVKEVMLPILVVILARQAKYSFLFHDMALQRGVTKERFDGWTDKEA